MAKVQQKLDFPWQEGQALRICSGDRVLSREIYHGENQHFQTISAAVAGLPDKLSGNTAEEQALSLVDALRRNRKFSCMLKAEPVSTLRTLVEYLQKCEERTAAYASDLDLTARYMTPSRRRAGMELPTYFSYSPEATNDRRLRELLTSLRQDLRFVPHESRQAIADAPDKKLVPYCASRLREVGEHIAQQKDTLLGALREFDNGTCNTGSLIFKILTGSPNAFDVAPIFRQLCGLNGQSGNRTLDGYDQHGVRHAVRSMNFIRDVPLGDDEEPLAQRAVRFMSTAINFCGESFHDEPIAASLGIRDSLLEISVDIVNGRRRNSQSDEIFREAQTRVAIAAHIGLVSKEVVGGRLPSNSFYLTSLPGVPSLHEDRDLVPYFAKLLS